MPQPTKVLVKVVGLLAKVNRRDTWPDGKKMQYPAVSLVIEQGMESVYVDIREDEVKEFGFEDKIDTPVEVLAAVSMFERTNQVTKRETRGLDFKFYPKHK